MLDDLDIYLKLDPSGMREHLRGMPKHWRHVWQAAKDFPIPDGFYHAEKVMVVGMGGSGIGGDFLKSLAALESPVPIFVQRDYQLPAFVDQRTLVIASSYSGNTEEVLSSLEEALARGAHVLAMTSGGKLLIQAKNRGFPVFLITYQAPPRAALGYSLIPQVVLLQHLGFLQPKDEEFYQAVETMESLLTSVGEEVPLEKNPAKKLAVKLKGRLPVIYGSEHLSEVAHRWKTQFNENSKSWAFYEVLPELHHNAVVGYSFPSELREKLLVIFLYSPSVHPRTLTRYAITEEILQEAGVSYETVEALGTSPFSQLLSTTLFGDYVSFYLALLNGVDPSPVPAIDYVKKRLGKP